MKRGCTPTAGLHTVNTVEGRGSSPQLKCVVEGNMWESFASWQIVSQPGSQSVSPSVSKLVSHSVSQSGPQPVCQTASSSVSPSVSKSVSPSVSQRVSQFISQVLLMRGGLSGVPEYLQGTLKVAPSECNWATKSWLATCHSGQHHRLDSSIFD